MLVAGLGWVAQGESKVEDKDMSANKQQKREESLPDVPGQVLASGKA
jgi:hypothetical protein